VTAPNLDESIFSKIVFRFSPPTRFGEAYLNEIRDNPTLRAFLHATVLRLIPNESGQSIKYAEAACNDLRLRFHARRFVLAAGGIENPRIMLASNSILRNGVGNDFDNVGRYFMEHPNLAAGTVLLKAEGYKTTLGEPVFRLIDHRLRSDVQLNARTQEERQVLNHSGYLVETEEDHGPIRGILSGLSPGSSERADSIKSYSLLFRFELAPYRENRVTLAEERDKYGVPKPKLHLGIGELEERTLQEFQMAFARQLGLSGVGRMKLAFPKGATGSWKDKVGWQWHHMGGTRMSSEPRKGVVDRNCRVHSVQNLYVAGSSVFPTGGHANPTLNLVALAMRLADHIIQEDKAHEG
jgi:choline dehydrogenase-like flavoprotein